MKPDNRYAAPTARPAPASSPADLRKATTDTVAISRNAAVHANTFNPALAIARPPRGTFPR